MVISALGGITIPVAQSLVTRQVDPREQGAVQGALTSLASLAAILMPPLATWLFGELSQPDAAVHLPGIGFAIGALMSVAGTLVALRSLRAVAPRLAVDESASGY
jgi:DHA1 family tetracycline resistance protein-like MFS transporter